MNLPVASYFLVSVRSQIAISMWVGYEIGGAHAHGVPRAKMVFDQVPAMPSVLKAIQALRNRSGTRFVDQ